jgi:hypothetical protein
MFPEPRKFLMFGICDEIFFLDKEKVTSLQNLSSKCLKFSNCSYSKTNQMHQFLKLFILHYTLHVSEGISVHHQEFKTVHTATGICQRDTATYLLAGTSWN